jgi:DNA-binding IclR family transcriptional regulator
VDSDTQPRSGLEGLSFRFSPCRIGQALPDRIDFRHEAKPFLYQLAEKGLPGGNGNNILNSKELAEHLSTAKSQGFAVDNEDGIRFVAAFLGNYRGEVIAGIRISGPAVWITEERLSRQFRSQVMKAAI